MSKITVVWQLPVKNSNKTTQDWVHPKAKYHAFQNNNSVCGKYYQDTDFFETDMSEGTDRKHVCKVCLKKLDDIHEGECVE